MSLIAAKCLGCIVVDRNLSKSRAAMQSASASWLMTPSFLVAGISPFRDGRTVMFKGLLAVGTVCMFAASAGGPSANTARRRLLMNAAGFFFSGHNNGGARGFKQGHHRAGQRGSAVAVMFPAVARRA